MITLIFLAKIIINGLLVLSGFYYGDRDSIPGIIFTIFLLLLFNFHDKI